MGDTDRKRFVLDNNILPPEPLAIYSFQQHDVPLPIPSSELNRIQDGKPDTTWDTQVTICASDSQYQKRNYRCQKGQYIRTIQTFKTQCLFSHGRDEIIG
ncbi:putative ATPase related to phosphate starvation-inducible protein PhoH [Vibrio spartinae]|uniref:ATPase related to phosphate starvation-inducible protein PhoH n=1 Tax=Vibrio spartinae TaxID=1918945 RepID=A0ABX6QW51_9VIBR|nr:putative ATPase related to phosphate starvation-inducible protein PhoH [Vibrio spartinae]